MRAWHSRLRHTHTESDEHHRTRLRTTDSSVLLPALGTPTMPTSATSLSSRSSQSSDPAAPCSAMAGALFRAVLNDALPRPPRPPADSSALSPAHTHGRTSCQPLAILKISKVTRVHSVPHADETYCNAMQLH